MASGQPNVTCDIPQLGFMRSILTRSIATRSTLMRSICHSICYVENKHEQSSLIFMASRESLRLHCPFWPYLMSDSVELHVRPLLIG